MLKFSVSPVGPPAVPDVIAIVVIVVVIMVCDMLLMVTGAHARVRTRGCACACAHPRARACEWRIRRPITGQCSCCPCHGCCVRCCKFFALCLHVRGRPKRKTCQGVGFFISCAGSRIDFRSRTAALEMMPTSI